ncbi:hypothetical protein OEA41_005397 [Lepraria neglecta]|uniref:Uncharacterized protein n=1 Tax=Lepraria neglecta TaxID=209136 RepID=A0AAD9YZQ1_9LECA|nr:hypothetical protein OEA41_005397 [Lepraria neglecta]
MDPNTDPTYHYMDSVNASWTSTLSSPTLLLVCQLQSSGDWGVSEFPTAVFHSSKQRDLMTMSCVESNQSACSTGSQIVALDFATAPYICFFSVSVGADNSVKGNEFNVVNQTSPQPITWSPTSDMIHISTSTASRTPSITHSPSTPSSSATAVTTTVSASLPPATKNGNGGGDMSTGQKTAMGVGISASVLMLMASASFYIQARTKWKRSQISQLGQAVSSKAPVNELQSSSPISEKDGRADHEKFGHPVAGAKVVGELEVKVGELEGAGTGRPF